MDFVKASETATNSGIERDDQSSHSACTKESKVDKQCKTESSSSSSITPRVIVTASSIDSCHEMSLEIQSGKPSRTYVTDCSNCTKPKGDLKEAGVGQSQPGLETRDAGDTVKCSETLDNLSGGRSCDDLSGMSSENSYAAIDNIDSSNSQLFKKENEKVVACSEPKLLGNKLDGAGGEGPKVAKVTDQDFESCLTDRASEQIKDQGKSFTLRPCLNVQQPPPMSHEASGDICKIDLNEDAVDHEVGSVLWKPKPVIATPLYLPISYEKKVGGGWRGSTANSAFRAVTPTLIYMTRSEDKALLVNGDKRMNIKSIDLNLDIDIEPVQDKSKARKFDFDLNCVGENDDNCHEPALQSSVRDFDLNETLVPTDTFNDDCHPSQSIGVSPVESSKQQEFQSFRASYYPPTDFRPVPGFVHAGNGHPFLIAPPNMQQQRMSFLPPQLTHFQVDPKAGPTHGLFPYMVDPHSTGIMSQMLNTTGGAHVFQVPHVPTANNIAISRPNIDVYNGFAAMENINRGANNGQIFVPFTNPALEEQMKSFQQIGGAKRREPEGGWDSHQLSLKQMTSWH